MVIAKFNRGKGKYTIGSQASINANNSSSTTTSSSSSNDNYLWGNHNDGISDVEDTIFVNGSVYAMPSMYGENDEEEDTSSEEGEIEDYQPKEFEPFEDDNGGNVYAQNLIKSFGDIEGKSVYGKTIYLDYPELKNDSSNKTNLLDILKDHKKITFKDSKNNELGTFDNTADKTITIKNYDDEISSLNSRVGTNETNITNLTTRVGNNETEITNIWETINSTDTSSPVVLFSGSIHSNNQDTSSTNYQPWNVRPNLYSQHLGVNNIEFNYYEESGEKKPSLVVTLKAKDGWTIKPTSVNSSVTLAAHWNPLVDFGGNRRSQGYWTTGGVFIDGKIYLQVWRTGDDNNDTVTNDCIAWQAQEMNVTIYGTAFKNS